MVSRSTSIIKGVHKEISAKNDGTESAGFHGRKMEFRRIRQPRRNPRKKGEAVIPSI